MPKSRPIISEATYFITCVTEDRCRWFANPSFAQLVIDQWRHYAAVYEFQLITYTVLPDHCHVVLNVGVKKTISQILHAVNSYTTTLINECAGNRVKRQVWQHDSWDEVIRSEEMYWEKVAYVLVNAWREGLVARPIDAYPFSDIGEWIAREGEEFVWDLFARHKRWAE